MRKFVGLSLLVACFAPALTGCSQHAGVVRGQNPCPNGQCPPPGAMAGHPGMYDGWNCRRPCDNGCPPPQRIQGANYRYMEPSCLQYPNQPDVPAVVQYPYYTLKGPDCFFYDSDG